MRENPDSRKYRLIQEIMRIDQKEDLSKLKDQVESLHRKDDVRFQEAVKPIRESVTLEVLIAEQNDQPYPEVSVLSKNE